MLVGSLVLAKSPDLKLVVGADEKGIGGNIPAITGLIYDMVVTGYVNCIVTYPFTSPIIYIGGSGDV